MSKLGRISAQCGTRMIVSRNRKENPAGGKCRIKLKWLLLAFVGLGQGCTSSRLRIKRYAHFSIILQFAERFHLHGSAGGVALQGEIKNL